MWKKKYQTIKFNTVNNTLVVKISRDPKLNVVDARLHTELSWLFNDINVNSDAHSIVLTGEGESFSAGGDIGWFSKITPEEIDVLFVEARKIIVDMLEVRQPIIAAINGPAIGLGATLALFSDITVMGKSAIIADTHVLAGIAAGDGGASIWPWLIGMNKAKEYLLTGKKISSDKALELGLVNHVVDDSELMEYTINMAENLANGPQMAIRATKTSLNKILRDTVNLNLDTSLALEKECFYSKEHRELINKFLNK